MAPIPGTCCLDSGTVPRKSGVLRPYDAMYMAGSIGSRAGEPSDCGNTHISGGMMGCGMGTPRVLPSESDVGTGTCAGS